MYVARFSDTRYCPSGESVAARAQEMYLARVGCRNRKFLPRRNSVLKRCATGERRTG
jgi:hypothetical protein